MEYYKQKWYGSIFLFFLFFSMNSMAKDVQIYGHRGARSLAPENTIPGYSTALSIGVDFVDADIVVTKDKKLVVYHDLTLNPDLVKDKSRHFVTLRKPIYEMTFTELQEYDVGSLNPKSLYSIFFPFQKSVPNTKIPLLSDVIEYVQAHAKSKIQFQFEIKSDAERKELSPAPKEYASLIYAVLKKYKIVNDVEIQAFDWTHLYALQQLDTQLKTAYLVGYDDVERMHDPNPQVAGLWSGGKLLKDFNNSIPHMVKSLGGSCYEPEDFALTKQDLELSHSLGLKVVVWNWPEHVGTAFDVKTTKKMLEWGVDGIISDDPRTLKSLITILGPH